MTAPEDLHLFHFVEEPAVALGLPQNSLTAGNDSATPAIAGSRTGET